MATLVTENTSTSVNSDRAIILGANKLYIRQKANVSCDDYSAFFMQIYAATCLQQLSAHFRALTIRIAAR
jgi:hypothetical protein